MNFGRILTTTLLLCFALSGQAQKTLASAFDPPPGQGEPGSTAGGASRPTQSTCVDSSSTAPFTVLAPRTYLGLTTQARPTFWIYLPTTRSKTLEFSVFDRQRKGIYQTKVTIANKSGLVAITLPETAPALDLNQSYNWTVALVCNQKRRTEDWVIGGWIQRQAPTAQLQQRLSFATTTVDRAKLYAESQFWYDAIPLLIQPNQPSSEASLNLWSTMIQAAGLNRMADPNTLKIVNQ